MLLASNPVISSSALPRARRCGFSRRRWDRRGRMEPRVFCCSKKAILQVRKCCPLLESEMLQKGQHLEPNDWKAVPDIWKSSAKRYGDSIALVDPHHNPPSNFTYKQLEQEILHFSEGLRVVGVNPDEKLALFADNSCRWLIADQGIMAIGGIDVVRGTKSSVEELLLIYNHSDSIALVVDDPEFLNKIADTFLSTASIKFIILLWGDKSSLRIKAPESISIFSYDEIIDMGRENRKSLLTSHRKESYLYKEICPDDVGTIMYTSGTTGSPKGVMLTHRNLLHQINNLWNVLPTEAGDKFLSFLPPWHAYERACEYFIFSRGVEQVYSSAPKLKEDLQHYQPRYIISVPLVYGTLHSAIQKQISSSSALRKIVAITSLKLSLLYMEMKRIYEGKVLQKDRRKNSPILDGLEWLWTRVVAAILWPLHLLAVKLVYRKIHNAIRIRAGISGGGSLPEHIDKFYEAIEVRVQNGYGLTETSPVVAARRPTCNVLGTIGHPIRHTEVKIVDIETGKDIPNGSEGIIKVRGPQVMKGYYKNPSATKKVLDEEGWFDTGDIGWIAPEYSTGRSRRCGGMLVIEGRAKDTIVLSSGENVEPSELEAAALRSSLIQQIVVIGQDQRRVGALIVPNKDEILIAARERSLVPRDSSQVAADVVVKLLRDELRTWTSRCFFQIGPFLIVDEPFTIDNGFMTPTMKIRRDKVATHFKEKITNLYK